MALKCLGITFRRNKKATDLHTVFTFRRNKKVLDLHTFFAKSMLEHYVTHTLVSCNQVRPQLLHDSQSQVVFTCLAFVCGSCYALHGSMVWMATYLQATGALLWARQTLPRGGAGGAVQPCDMVV